MLCEFIITTSPWRNWLARLTVNQEVGGSSPPGDVSFFVGYLFTTLFGRALFLSFERFFLAVGLPLTPLSVSQEAKPYQDTGAMMGQVGTVQQSIYPDALLG